MMSTSMKSDTGLCDIFLVCCCSVDSVRVVHWRQCLRQSAASLISFMAMQHLQTASINDIPGVENANAICPMKFKQFRPRIVLLRSRARLGQELPRASQGRSCGREFSHEVQTVPVTNYPIEVKGQGSDKNCPEQVKGEVVDGNSPMKFKQFRPRNVLLESRARLGQELPRAFRFLAHLVLA